jgi:hypothetical protein
MNSSEVTLCSAEMAVRSDQALTSTLLCITSPTFPTPSTNPTSSTWKCVIHNACFRASGVSKTMRNRSKAHHQDRPRFELPGLREVRFGKSRVAFSRNTRTKTALDVGQLHAFPLALRSVIYLLCAACESGTPIRRFALARGAYNTDTTLWQRDNTNDKVASAVGQFFERLLAARTHTHVLYITPERFMPIHRFALVNGGDM